MQHSSATRKLRKALARGSLQKRAIMQCVLNCGVTRSPMEENTVCYMRMRRWLSTGLSIVLLSADMAAATEQSQNSSPLDTVQQMQAVNTRAMNDPISFSVLQQLTNEIGPRLTGSLQERRAGEWALDEMRKAGLTHVHAESWQLEKAWTRGYARGQMLSPFPLELILTSLGWAGSTPPGGVESDVVPVDAGALEEECRNHAAQWANKILLVAPKDPKHADFFQGMSKFPLFLSVAAEHHILAIIEADWRPGMVLPHTGPIAFGGPASDLPVISLANEQQQLISSIVDSGHPVRIKLDIRNTFSTVPVLSHNIVGEIRGSQHPEQIVIVGAHLDSWDLGTGAIDDGFGVAAVLGAAHSIISSGAKPKRTIRFVLFTGEEQGLLGSKAYLQAHAAEWHNIICAFALDWGNGPITKIPVAGHEELRAPFEDLFRSMPNLASIKVGSGFLMSTDAYAFTLAGIPGIAPFQDSPSYTMIGHSAADTLDKVNPQVLAQDSAILAVLALWLADHPQRLGAVWSREETAQKLSENGLTK